MRNASFALKSCRDGKRTSLNGSTQRVEFTYPAYGASSFAALISGRVVSQSQNSWYCTSRHRQPEPQCLSHSRAISAQRGTHPGLSVNQVRVRPAPHPKVRQPLTHAREGVPAQRAVEPERGAGELLDVYIGLAREQRLDVAQLLLAVDHLGVVPRERVRRSPAP